MIRSLNRAEKGTLKGVKSRTDGITLDLFFSNNQTNDSVGKWVSLIYLSIKLS